jgi:hypothetical protein
MCLHYLEILGGLLLNPCLILFYNNNFEYNFENNYRLKNPTLHLKLQSEVQGSHLKGKEQGLCPLELGLITINCVHKTLDVTCY